MTNERGRWVGGDIQGARKQPEPLAAAGTEMGVRQGRHGKAKRQPVSAGNALTRGLRRILDLLVPQTFPAPQQGEHDPSVGLRGSSDEGSHETITNDSQSRSSSLPAVSQRDDQDHPGQASDLYRAEHVENTVTAAEACLWADWGQKVIKKVLEAATGETRAALRERWGQVRWGEVERRYQEQMRKLHSTVHILGSHAPAPLEGIYIDLSMLDPPITVRRLDLRDLREDPSLLGVPKRISGLQLVTTQEGRRLFILGKPGAGKTTFLKYLALQAVKGKLDKVPILISLREWSDSGQALVPFLARQFEICGFPEAEPFLVHLLEEGQALVLLDGLNEVNREGGQRDRVIAALREFGERYLESQCLITCRVAETEYQFGQFNYVEIADFTNEQLQVYTRKWFARNPRRQERFLEEFAREEKRWLREFGRTPLLLSMLCLAFDKTEGFPQRRVDVYQEALNALLKRWDAKGGIERDGIYRWLTTDHRLQMLAHIAAKTFAEGKALFGQEELEEQIVAYLRRRLPASARGQEIDGEAELRAIQDQHGILVERAPRVYSFSHLTFQEYLTAWYIVDHAARATKRLRQNGGGTSELAGTGWLKGLIDQYLTDNRWREVFLLAASMLDDADLFFEQFALALGRMVREEDVIAGLVSWAEAQAGRLGNKGIKPSEMRSQCICFALALARALIRDRNLARDRDLVRDHARDLGRDLDRTHNLALSLDLDRDHARELARNLDRARARALDLQLERARAQDVDFDNALAHARALARDLDLDLGCAFARDLERECVLALAHANTRALDRDHARPLAHALDLDFERAIAHDLDCESARALARDFGLNFGLDFDFERVRELAFDLDLAKIRSLAEYLSACRLFVACMEVAYVSDREGLRDRLLRVPMGRKSERSDGEREASPCEGSVEEASLDEGSVKEAGPDEGSEEEAGREHTLFQCKVRELGLESSEG